MKYLKLLFLCLLNVFSTKKIEKIEKNIQITNHQKPHIASLDLKLNEEFVKLIKNHICDNDILNIGKNIEDLFENEDILAIKINKLKNKNLVMFEVLKNFKDKSIIFISINRFLNFIEMFIEKIPNILKINEEYNNLVMYYMISSNELYKEVFIIKILEKKNINN
jgi:hypothetical protein